MSLHNLGVAVEISKLLMHESLPKKDFFTWPEIAALLEISMEQIQSWEAEFPQIRLSKTHDGKRLYKRDDVLIFFAIKHLVKENNLPLSLALKILAELDTRGDEGFEPYSAEDLPEHSPPAEKSHDSDENVLINSTTSDESKSLQEASAEEKLLWDCSCLLPDEESGFDETAQEIYQECKDALEETQVLLKPNDMGEMLADALLTEQRRQLRANKLEEYARNHAILMEKRESLFELLSALEKYEPSSLFLHLKAY